MVNTKPCSREDFSDWYEYGTIEQFGAHDVSDTAETLFEAMTACQALEIAWSGEQLGTWFVCGEEIRAATSDEGEFWFVRRAA